MQVSLPNGLKGTVTRAEASDVFDASSSSASAIAKAEGAKARKLAAAESDSEDLSSSEEDEEEEEAEKLSLLDMFQVGGLYKLDIPQ